MMSAETEWAPDQVRAMRMDFPYLDECVYLNSASAGVSWKGQGTAAAAFYDDAKSRGMNGMATWQTAAVDVRARLGRHLGVRDDEIHFASSTTEALNLVIGAVQWRQGGEVVFAADEFPSVVLACESAGHSGATVRRVEFGAEDARESALIEALTPATRVMAVSHVHWVTGTRLDLARLAAACHAVGALLVVDGIQAMGAIPIELGETDVYCGAVFKWLLSGFGLAVLVMRDRAREVLSPRVRGYNNEPPSLEIQHSHVNYPGLYALSSCLNYLETVIGWDAVHARVRALTAELEFGLADLGLRVITPLDARAGIVSCEVPDAVAIRDRLADESIFVEARGGLLRVSPHFYNTSADLTAFLGAVSRNGPLSAR